MEDIEVLKQENEKLKGRLNKAVEVFNQQKAKIQELTGEVEDYKMKSLRILKMHRLH